MGFYIQTVVIDANVINARNNINAMNEIENFFALGIIQMEKTSALNVEFKNHYNLGEVKASLYGTIYGPNWIGHTDGLLSGGERESLMEKIYSIIWGKVWMKGNSDQKAYLERSFRDAIHLDISYMNCIDYFITNEKILIEKRNELNANGIDVNIVTPEECLKALKENIKQDTGTDDPKLVSIILSKFYPLVLGSNDCTNVNIQDPKDEEILFRTYWDNDILQIEATVYSKEGKKLSQIYPNSEPIIFDDDSYVHVSDPAPKEYKISVNKNTIVGQYLRIANNSCSHFTIGDRSNNYLVGRILPSGHLSLNGSIYNKQGDLIVEINKRELKTQNMTYKNSTKNTLP